ncbi:hypothetical protein Taro_046499 [Colocasia esculenta]|uniref:Uncharacterized protein n=1 Tax=Colocasia esculenta TaxID=4460 RepID=A0A843WQ39_COLES|nr:hypothetical protein [Colocasia esculenta]
MLTDCKMHIVQRGAVRPLIEMLQSSDVQLKEMSAFALGRLAQDTHNQAGITYSGPMTPLLKLLDSKNGSLQHNAAFALYGLADSSRSSFDDFNELMDEATPAEGSCGITRRQRDEGENWVDS